MPLFMSHKMPNRTAATVTGVVRLEGAPGDLPCLPRPPAGALVPGHSEAHNLHTQRANPPQFLGATTEFDSLQLFP